MKPINKVIALINRIEDIDTILKSAVKYCDRFGGVLEVLYVHESPLFELPDYFNRKDITKSDSYDHQIDKEAIKEEIESNLEKIGFSKSVAIFVEIDDTPHRIWALARDDRETLVVTKYHKEISKKLANNIQQHLLILKSDTDITYKNSALVSTGFHTLKPCLELANTIDNKKPFFIFDYRFIIDPSMEYDIQNLQIIEEAQRESFTKVKDEYQLEGEFFVDGSFFDDSLVTYIKKRGFDLLYLCLDDKQLIDELIDDLSCDFIIKGELE